MDCRILTCSTFTMRDKIIAFILTIFASLIVVDNSVAQDLDLNQLEKEVSNTRTARELKDQAKKITLQDAIEEGLRNNFNEKVRSYTFQLNELDFKDDYESFWYPKLNLTMQTSGDQFIDNVYRDPNTNAQDSTVSPNGFVGLEIEDYTLFNWGRDYLDYLSEKNTYQRNKQRLKEQKRALRFNIIAEYFNLARQNNIVKILKRQLSHTSFIYRLAKEKMRIRKINSQEFLQTKQLFLKAHKNYQDALFTYYEIQESLARYLGDDLETIYFPLNELKFEPMTIKLSESLAITMKNSPDLLDARVEMENASRSYQKSLKDNLPLPEITMKLGSYQRQFSGSGYDDTYETFDGSKNVEIAASVNMTWTIYGSGGFLNSRVQESSFYQKKIREVQLREAHRDIKVTNKLTHSRVIYLQKKFSAVEKERETTRRVFDKAVDNYIASKTKFADIYQVLEELQTSQVHYENTKYEHLLEKLKLAQLMGVDDFPGEKFDTLVLK